jgi:hypothetical protein
MAIDWDAHVLAPLFAQFAEDVQPTYTPKGGTPFAIDGVFERAYQEVLIDAEAAGGVGMNTVKPALGVRLAQFPDPPVQGDKVFVASVGLTYVVNNVQPDGLGWAWLILNKAA